MKQKKTVWRLIAKSLGEKAGKNDAEADRIALIRLLMFLSIFMILLMNFTYVSFEAVLSFEKI